MLTRGRARLAVKSLMKVPMKPPTMTEILHEEFDTISWGHLEGSHLPLVRRRRTHELSREKLLDLGTIISVVFMRIRYRLAEERDEVTRRRSST